MKAQQAKTHKITHTSKSCDCGANDCHGHTIHYLNCACGWEHYIGVMPSDKEAEKAILEHSTSFDQFKQLWLSFSW